jgi:hypothetical protein
VYEHVPQLKSEKYENALHIVYCVLGMHKRDMYKVTLLVRCKGTCMMVCIVHSDSVAGEEDGRRPHSPSTLRQQKLAKQVSYCTEH